MPEMTAYSPGVPCWVDLSSPDLEASKAFYGGLFGWGSETDPDPQYGGYAQFTLDGRPVAGLMTIMTEGQPPFWNSYISVTDADATAVAVQSAGGKVLVEPMDVGPLGRMGFFFDSLGAVFGVWQPGTFHGAAVVNEPGAFCWNELACRDLEAAKRFYTEAVGWESATSEYGGMPYTEWHVEGRSIAGMIEMNEQWPAEVPPHWMVYFAVSDCDATAARAGELGGTVSVPPTDIPIGRFAVLNDPHGAVFSVIALSVTGSSG